MVASVFKNRFRAPAQRCIGRAFAPLKILHAHLVHRQKGIVRAPFYLTLSHNRQKVGERREGKGKNRKNKGERNIIGSRRLLTCY